MKPSPILPEVDMEAAVGFYESFGASFDAYDETYAFVSWGDVPLNPCEPVFQCGNDIGRYRLRQLLLVLAGV